MTSIVDDFTQIGSALREWPKEVQQQSAFSAPARRLLHAARAAADTPEEVGASDLALLLRHVLRAETEASEIPQSLLIPREPPWPEAHRLPTFGMNSIAEGEFLRVFAEPWQPDWLDLSEEDPAASAFRGFNRPPIRPADEQRGDPYLGSATGSKTYRSAGQREAIRTVLGAAQSATIIGNLPTGSGKSMVGYIEALVSRTPGTTLVVVPTTSLAIDQERAFREWIGERGDVTRFPARLCYHGELSPEAKAEIRRQIAEGTQGIVFTSPESLMGSLSTAVYRAAERGLLRSLVVDEAHIVSHWGKEFRPAFQALAGVRTDLLATATDAGRPFRTVLLSATLTEESIFTLQRLFGDPGPTELISSVALRHEPSYWLASGATTDERNARILEGIMHLPRPLVLYTTRVEAAKEWRTRLAEHGFRRLMLVAGETSVHDRREAIRRLREDALDVVVATSAFGLGVDQPDIRAVVHACVPETIDRFYQEVGRGGRDGLPSVSLLVEGPGDRATARHLASPKLISLERGFERWREMQIRATRLGENRFSVPLDVSPADLTGDTAENRAWNLRTLLLMSRSGLLTLEASPPPRQAADESVDEWDLRAEQAFAEYAATAEFRVDGAFADQMVWERAVGPARRQALAADRDVRERMEKALQPKTQICQLLAQTYHVATPVRGVSETQIPITVAPSCGGCPGCRDKSLPPRRYPAAVPLPATHCAQTWASEFQPWLGGRHVLVVTYDPVRDWPDAIIRALEKLASRGMWCLGAPDAIRNSPDVHRLYQRAAAGVIFELEDWDLLHAPRLPTGLVFAPTAHIPPDAVRDSAPSRVLLVCEDARTPAHPTARIGEYHPSVSIQSLLER